MAWWACHSDPGYVVQGTQCSVVTQRGKKSKKEGIYIYIYLRFTVLCSRKQHSIVKQLYFNIN